MYATACPCDLSRSYAVLSISVCVSASAAIVAAGPAPIVPTNKAEADKLKSMGASAKLGRAIDWPAMVTAGDSDFDAKPRTGEWAFATAEWEREQEYLAFVHVCAAEEQLASWKALHQSEELKRALHAEAELERHKSHQVKTISVSSDIATGDAFFIKNKNIKPSVAMMAHDMATDKRVRNKPSERAAASVCMPRHAFAYFSLFCMWLYGLMLISFRCASSIPPRNQLCPMKCTRAISLPCTATRRIIRRTSKALCVSSWPTPSSHCSLCTTTSPSWARRRR